MTRLKKVFCELETLIKIFQEPNMTLKILLDIINFINPEHDIKKILLNDELCKNLEERGQENILIQLAEELKKENGCIEYQDSEYSSKEIITYCIEQNIYFFSFNFRLTQNYLSKIKEQNINIINYSQIKKIIKLWKSISEISDKNLFLYLENLFETKIIDFLDYGLLSEEKKMEIILCCLVKQELKGETEEFTSLVMNGIVSCKHGKITKNVFKRNLIKLEERGYKFNVLDCEETLEEKYQNLIDRFLKEKNIPSFESLLNMYIFEKKDDIIKKIVNYYN